jgi:hypothetical protein
MSVCAARSIEVYLRQLQAALAGEEAALIQEALALAEEFLRAEVVACRDRSEGDVLELISSTYGAPEDLAEVYQTAPAFALGSPRHVCHGGQLAAGSGGVRFTGA